MSYVWYIPGIYHRYKLSGVSRCGFMICNTYVHWILIQFKKHFKLVVFLGIRRFRTGKSLVLRLLAAARAPTRTHRRHFRVGRPRRRCRPGGGRQLEVTRRSGWLGTAGCKPGTPPDHHCGQSRLPGGALHRGTSGLPQCGDPGPAWPAGGPARAGCACRSG